MLAIPQPSVAANLLLATTALGAVIYATTLATFWAGYRTGGWLVNNYAKLPSQPPWVDQ